MFALAVRFSDLGLPNINKLGTRLCTKKKKKLANTNEV